MKQLRYLIFLAFTSSVMGFFPRTYQQAEILPGELNLTVSTSTEAYTYYFWEIDETGIGQNIQVAGRWSHSNWEKLAIIACAGGLFCKGFGLSLTDLGPIDSTGIGIVPNIGLGLHWEFVERPTFALQFSAEFPTLLSLTLLSGINSWRLDREVVTIGLKTFPGPAWLPIIPAALFIAVHPTPRLHILGGLSVLWSAGGEVHVGIGYSFGRLRGEE